MSIKHNVYEDGRVQSLGFVTDEGQDASVGICEVGEYDFGVAERREELRVLTGVLATITDAFGLQHWISFDNPLVFEKGERIRFAAAEGTSYLCLYGEKP